LIALDTNVLVRFLVTDDADQSARAVALVERAIQADVMIYLSDIVMVETVWVLGRSYRFTRAEIAAIIHRLLAARHLELGSRGLITLALHRFETGKGDFADYLIAEQAHAQGIGRLVTFDRALLREAGFAAPD